MGSAGKERDELREALRPFAKTGSIIPPKFNDGFDISIYAPAAGHEYDLSGDHLRRAARLLPAEPNHG